MSARACFSTGKGSHTAIRALSRAEGEDSIGGWIGIRDAMDGDTDVEAVALERPGRDFKAPRHDTDDGYDAEGKTADSGLADHQATVDQADWAIVAVE